MPSFSRVGLPKYQLVQRADQLVAIVGERAAQLDLVVEGADLRAIDRQQPQQELLGGAVEQLEIGRHAGAGVEHHHGGEGLRLGREQRHLGRLAVVEHAEVRLLQVRDEAAVGVDHRRVNRHGAHARAEDGCCGCASTSAPANSTATDTSEDILCMTTFSFSNYYLTAGMTDPAIGLCATCRHCRAVPGGRSTFYMCRRLVYGSRLSQVSAVARAGMPGLMSPSARRRRRAQRR